MDNTFFLTGRPRQGKTSLLLQAIQPYLSHVGGFGTQRLTKNGVTWAFRLLDLRCEDYITELETSLSFPDIAIGNQTGGKWEPRPEVFNNKGRQALLSSLQERRPLIVMDELGIFEEDAQYFKEAVFSTLSAPVTVIGVIKDKPAPFLDKVRRKLGDSLYYYQPTQQALLLDKLLTFLHQRGLRADELEP